MSRFRVSLSTTWRRLYNLALTKQWLSQTRLFVHCLQDFVYVLIANIKDNDYRCIIIRELKFFMVTIWHLQTELYNVLEVISRLGGK